MRVRSLTSTIAIAISCAAIPHAAIAQNIGTLIGANISSISGADEGIGEIFGNALKQKKRVGLKGGFYLKIPLTGMFSLEPELLYAQNGVTYTTRVGVSQSFDVNLGYVEVPILLRADLLPKSHIHPILLAGGSGARRVQCTFNAASAGTTLKEDCNADSAFDDPFKKADYSVIGAAGLAANLAGFSVSLQLRFQQGLSSISADETELTKAKNRSMSVLLGFTF